MAEDKTNLPEDTIENTASQNDPYTGRCVVALEEPSSNGDQQTVDGIPIFDGPGDGQDAGNCESQDRSVACYTSEQQADLPQIHEFPVNTLHNRDSETPAAITSSDGSADSDNGEGEEHGGPKDHSELSSMDGRASAQSDETRMSTLPQSQDGVTSTSNGPGDADWSKEDSKDQSVASDIITDEVKTNGAELHKPPASVRHGSPQTQDGVTSSSNGPDGKYPSNILDMLILENKQQRTNGAERRKPLKEEGKGKCSNPRWKQAARCNRAKTEARIIAGLLEPGPLTFELLADHSFLRTVYELPLRGFTAQAFVSYFQAALRGTVTDPIVTSTRATFLVEKAKSDPASARVVHEDVVRAYKRLRRSSRQAKVSVLQPGTKTRDWVVQCGGYLGRSRCRTEAAMIARIRHNYCESTFSPDLTGIRALERSMRPAVAKKPKHGCLQSDDPRAPTMSSVISSR